MRRFFVKFRACAVVSCVVLLVGVRFLYADEWDDFYRLGVQALEYGQWEVAVVELQQALASNPQPDAQATTSNLKLIEYLPYFYLGQAYLFKGDYASALRHFQNCLRAGAILNTKRRDYLDRLISLTRKMLAQDVDPQFEAGVQQLETELKEEQFTAAHATLLNLRRRRPGDARLPVFENWLQQSEKDRRTLDDSRPKQAEVDLEKRFREGLDFYLLGRYPEALNVFRQIAAENPDFYSAQSWLQKIRTEMTRLQVKPQQDTIAAPPPIIIEKTVTRTTAPVFAIRSPASGVSTVRAKEVLFSGQVGDDRGINFIEFTVNGQPLLDSANQILRLRPAGKSDAKRYTFARRLPLRLGENQIVLTAYDVDSLQKRSSVQFTVVRKPPVYRTTTFLVVVLAALLLAVASFFITRMVKYRLAIINKYNPYIAGSPIRSAQMFFGREDLIKRILNTIHNNSLMIYGPRRIGKTSLQHQIKQRLESAEDPEYAFFPVFIDLQGTTEQTFFTTMMEEILETCKSRLASADHFKIHQNRGHYSGRDFSHDLKKVLKTLSEGTDKQVKLVLQIDEVDELNKYSEQVNQKLRSVFMKTFAENLVAIMSGAHIRKNWQSEGSPWYNFFDEVAVPPLKREDAERLIKRPVTGIFTYDDAAVARIVQLSGGQPYMIQRFCMNVIHRIIENKRRKVTLADVEAVKYLVLKNDIQEEMTLA